MTDGESPRVHRQTGENTPRYSTAPRPARERTGRAKARANTAREKENEKEIKAGERREDNHPKADALSAVVSTGRRSARKTL